MKQKGFSEFENKKIEIRILLCYLNQNKIMLLSNYSWHINNKCEGFLRECLRT